MGTLGRNGMEAIFSYSNPLLFESLFYHLWTWNKLENTPS